MIDEKRRVFGSSMTSMASCTPEQNSLVQQCSVQKSIVYQRVQQIRVEQSRSVGQQSLEYRESSIKDLLLYATLGCRGDHFLVVQSSVEQRRVQQHRVTQSSLQYSPIQHCLVYSVSKEALQHFQSQPKKFRSSTMLLHSMLV